MAGLQMWLDSGAAKNKGLKCVALKYLFVFLAALMVFHPAYSAELFGTVDAVSGSAEVIDQSGKSTPVSVGQKIFEGQTIDSGQDGEVHLVTEDGGIIAVRPHTIFRVDEYKAEGKSTDKIFMSLLRGSIRSITGWVGKYNNSAYRIATPTATIGIRGTDHETTVVDYSDGDEPGTYDNVNEGATVMKTAHGSAEVAPGKFAFAPKNRAVAPFFLAHSPRFLEGRRLRIEERIQQRKELFRGRLKKMREERIRHPGSIQGSRIKQERQQHFGARRELNEQRSAQPRLRQQERRAEVARNRERRQSEFKAQPQRRKVDAKNGGGREEEGRRLAERRKRIGERGDGDGR